MNKSFEEIHVEDCKKPDYCMLCEMEEEQDALCDPGYLLEDDLEMQKYPYLLTKAEREDRVETILSLIMGDPKPNCEREF